MNRTNVRRVIVGTLALSFALGGLYISSGRTVRAASIAALQSISGSGVQQSSSVVTEPKTERSRANAGETKVSKTPIIVTEAASVLGMDANALRQQLQSGKSIVDVAKEKGVSEADLTAKMLQLRVAHIDEAVKKGKIDAAKAEQMKQRMSSHLSYMLNEKGLPEKHAMHKGHGMKPNPEQLATVLGISKDELKAQLQSGKSLAEIAAAKGMSRDQLIAKLKEQMTPQLERWVDRKHIDKKAQ